MRRMRRKKEREHDERENRKTWRMRLRSMRRRRRRRRRRRERGNCGALELLPDTNMDGGASSPRLQQIQKFKQCKSI